MPDLPRRLGLTDAVSLFVGIILGSGIFVAPAAVAGVTRSPWIAAGLWIVGGVITVCGAFCYAECGARLPRTGGFYVFYREAFGDALAFVGGWVALFVTYPASIAAIALIFAQYLGEAVPALRGAGGGLLPSAVILAAGALNIVGVRTGALTQRVLAGTKVAALGALSLAAVLVADTPRPSELGADHGSAPVAWVGLLSALVALLWTYDGWSDVTLVSGEIRDPSRNLALAVLVGTGILVLLYTAVQLAVGVLLAPGAAATSASVVTDAVQAGLGPRAGRLVALLVVVSTFGSINGIVLAVSRLGFAMARDGAFVRWFGAIHPRWETPARSTGMLVAASIFYVHVGTFRNLLQYFSFSVWIFYGLTAIAVLKLRRRRVGGEGAWTAPGGVAAPAVVLATGTGMTVGLMVQDTASSLHGVGMLAAGFVAYGLWRRFSRGR